jgi:hypothetical protein
MDQSILNSVFQKSVATDITTVVTGITIVAMGVDNSYVAMSVDDVIMSVVTIFLFKCVQALSSNPVISPPHTHRHPLLLRVHLHRAPSSTSSACTYTLMPRSSSTPSPRSSSTSKSPETTPSTPPSPPCLRTMSSAWPSPPHPGTAVGTTLLLRRQVHASPSSFTCSKSTNTLSFSLPL